MSRDVGKAKRHRRFKNKHPKRFESLHHRSCFKSDGAPKARLTKEQAEVFGADNDCEAYGCLTCGYWHTAHTSSRERA